MNRRCLVPGVLLWVSALPVAALAGNRPAESAKLRELAVSAGRWVYHGEFRPRARAAASAWSWHEDCRWSANRAFMVCSFSNTWAGRHVDSVVVDTYDRHDHTFWHYEVFDSGRSAGKPFAARMQINGPMRIESWTRTRNGKPVRDRIVYDFTSASRVTVRFQQSEDGIHWVTTASGAGEKIGALAARAPASQGRLRE
jgi:hypothetical protein